MSDSEEWGAGSKRDAKAFGTTLVGGHRAELITGEHPHSRSDNKHYARYGDADDPRIVGFNGHRLLWHIEVETSNYLKSSGMSGDEVRKGCSWKISLKEPAVVEGTQLRVVGGDRKERVLPKPVMRLVYEGRSREPEDALRKAASALVRLQEHPANLWEPGFSDLIGRKVYYGQVPSVVTSYLPEQGCVCLKPEEGLEFPRAVWLDDDEEHDSKHFVKVDILESGIYWFRSED